MHNLFNKYKTNKTFDKKNKIKYYFSKIMESKILSPNLLLDDLFLKVEKLVHLQSELKSLNRQLSLENVQLKLEVAQLKTNKSDLTIGIKDKDSINIKINKLVKELDKSIERLSMNKSLNS